MTRLKRLVIEAYCRGWISARMVALAFRLRGMRGA